MRTAWVIPQVPQASNTGQLPERGIDGVPVSHPVFFQEYIMADTKEDEQIKAELDAALAAAIASEPAPPAPEPVVEDPVPTQFIPERRSFAR